MASTIRLTVLTGPHRGARFCMRGLHAFMLGRSPECQVQLCGNERDQRISRNHCQILIDPPYVRIQDMDSVNGTYINGKRVGANETDEAALGRLATEIGLAKDGDILTVGDTTLQVHIMECHEEIGLQGVLRDCPVDC